ncbi:phage tail assembly chaperone [Methylorubrum populi]|uniref:phage tail assembly chaperone n=1 Tax=Methylorubrum populi TaxID=223967 RepID=UPI003CCECD4B
MAAEDGIVPAALVQQPDLPDRLAFVWGAFHDLRDERALGFGSVGAIPWSAMDRYAQRSGLSDSDEFARFTALLRAMDAVWLAWMREKMKPTGT